MQKFSLMAADSVHKQEFSWTPELVDAAHQLLAEYHGMFSLDPAE